MKLTRLKRITGTLTIMKKVLFIGIFCTIFNTLPVSAEETLTIEEAVLEAISTNPSIREAGANQEAAMQTVKSERADLLPQLSLGYGYTALKETPIRKTENGPMQVAHQYQYGWDVTVVQPLFAGFALHSKLKISQLESVAKDLEKQQTILDIALATRRACHHLLLAEKLLMVSNHEVESLEAHRREAALFYREGLISPNDQLKAEVALANTLQTREKVRAQVQKAKFAINQLLNRPLDGEVHISDKSKATSDKYNLNQLSDQAISDRPIMQLLDIGMEKLGYSRKMAQSGWYPQVSLVGSYMQSGKDSLADENEYADNDESFVALQAKWNFFSSGKTTARTNTVDQQIKGLSARIDNYRTRVLNEVRSAVLDCDVAFKNIRTAEKALDQARENYRITNLQYQQQAATSTDVLDANKFLTQADSNYFTALYGYLDANAALERAIGKKP